MRSLTKLLLLPIVTIGGAAGVEAGKNGETEFVYRGMIPLTAKMVGSVPAGVSGSGVEVQVAGVMIDGMDFSFNFGMSSEAKPVGVVVEDVTAATALRLVEQFPAVGVRQGEDGRWIWFGTGGKRNLEKKTAPWVFTDGGSNFVFRFFLELEGGRRVEIYQPAIIGEEFKKSARGRISEAGIDGHLESGQKDEPRGE